MASIGVNCLQALGLEQVFFSFLDSGAKGPRLLSQAKGPQGRGPPDGGPNCAGRRTCLRRLTARYLAKAGGKAGGFARSQKANQG